MKRLVIVLFFISKSAVGQFRTGAMKIEIKELDKSETGWHCLINEPITVVLNDSLTLNITTDSLGFVIIKNLVKGSYDLKVVCSDCRVAEVKSLFIGEGKTCYVVLPIRCTSYINSLSKKERKKLEYFDELERKIKEQKQ